MARDHHFLDFLDVKSIATDSAAYQFIQHSLQHVHNNTYTQFARRFSLMSSPPCTTAMRMFTLIKS